MVSALVAALLVLHAADGGAPHSPYEVAAPQVPDKCKTVRAQARLQMQVRALELKLLIQTLADASCATFEVEKATNARISIDPDAKEPRSFSPDELLAEVKKQVEEQGLYWELLPPARYRIRRIEKRPDPAPVKSSGPRRDPLPPHRHGNDKPGKP